MSGLNIEGNKRMSFMVLNPMSFKSNQSSQRDTRRLQEKKDSAINLPLLIQQKKDAKYWQNEEQAFI